MEVSLYAWALSRKKFKATREFKAGGKKSILENCDCVLPHGELRDNKVNLYLEIDWIADCQFL